MKKKEVKVKNDSSNKNESNKKINLKKFIYIALRIAVIICMIRQIQLGNIANAVLCVFTLILFSLTVIIEHKFNVDFPDLLEITVWVFIFSAEILGEINEFYIHFENWDLILHTTNGFIMAGIGYSLIELLNKNENISVNLSPIYVTIVAICFSMTIGVFWEFFEYGVDKYLHKDMQKDTVINTIYSVTLNDKGKNEVVEMPIESVIVNGQDWTEMYGGYIDIGLNDTMEDLFVNFIGAVIFSVFGYLYTIGKGKYAKNFIVKRKHKTE